MNVSHGPAQLFRDPQALGHVGRPLLRVKRIVFRHIVPQGLLGNIIFNQVGMNPGLEIFLDIYHFRYLGQFLQPSGFFLDPAEGVLAMAIQARSRSAFLDHVIFAIFLGQVDAPTIAEMKGPLDLVSSQAAEIGPFDLEIIFRQFCRFLHKIRRAIVRTALVLLPAAVWGLQAAALLPGNFFNHFLEGAVAVVNRTGLPAAVAQNIGTWGKIL